MLNKSLLPQQSYSASDPDKLFFSKEHEIEMSDHLTCLLRNLYAGQEATVKLYMEQQAGSK